MKWKRCLQCVGLKLDPSHPKALIGIEVQHELHLLVRLWKHPDDMAGIPGAALAAEASLCPKLAELTCVFELQAAGAYRDSELGAASCLAGHPVTLQLG